MSIFLKVKKQIFKTSGRKFQIPEHISAAFSLRNPGVKCLSWSFQVVSLGKTALGCSHLPWDLFCPDLSCAPGAGKGVKETRTIGSKRDRRRALKRWPKEQPWWHCLWRGSPTGERSPGCSSVKSSSTAQREGGTFRQTLSSHFPPSFCVFNSFFFKEHK